MDLSYPHGDAINDFIDKEEFSLRYVTVDRAVEYILELSKGCYLNKIDIENPFRIIPVSPLQWHLLGIYWQGKYFVDTRLSMGGRSSPGIFDNLPRAVEWICKYNYDLQWLCHLLDDFLSAEPVSLKGHSISTPKNVFALLLGIPIAPGKIEEPCTTLEFLVITLDTVLFEARLSTEKVNKLGDTLTKFLGKNKCSKRELLSLVGSLSFACKVVVPGRAFLSRMIMSKLKDHTLNVKFRDREILYTTSYKYLGIYLDPSLNMIEHLHKTYKKASGRLKLLKRLRSSLTITSALAIYNAMITPVFSYCAVLTTCSCSTYTRKLDSFEERAISIIVGQSKHIANIKVPSVNGNIKKRCATLTFKCLKGDVCINFQHYFTIMDSVKCTRNNKCLIRLPKVRLESARKAFYFQGAVIFNSLTLELRSAETAKDFLIRYKKYEEHSK